MDCFKTVIVTLTSLLTFGCQTTVNQGAPVAITAPADPPVNAVMAPLPSLLSPLELAQEAIGTDLSAAPAFSPAPPPEPDLWRDLRAGMRLDLRLDEPRVQQELRWFKRHPQYLPRLAPRLQNYLPYIAEQARLRNLPAELALLPIIESAMDTFAFSHGGAAGPWQFVRGTALQYKLQINDWYDGRRDVVASTDAALTYLQDLHRRFDDWNLALAGYNAGQGNVNRALRRTPGGDFFALRLPRETQAYVPRLLALAAVVKTPDAFGITLPKLKPEQAFTTLHTHSQFQLDKLAQATGLEMETLYRWNPALSKWATPPKGPHRIIVPLTPEVETMQNAVNDHPAKQRMDWQQVTVKAGDTLSQIARRHGTDVSTLKSANQLRGHHINIGHKLLIPMRGDVSPPIAALRHGKDSYEVRTGDSLWSIAKAHKVSMHSLIRANHVGPKEVLSVGQQLVIPNGKSGRREVTRTVHYKVRRGDSLARIAGKFNVTIKQIARWNGLNVGHYLQPGQPLKLHVNVLAGN